MYTVTLPINLGDGNTGITLTGQLVTTSGVASGDAISTGFIEIGGGYYLLTTTIVNGFRGGLKILSGVTLMAFFAINPEEIEYLAGINTRTSIQVNVVVLSPVLENGDVETIQGDAYSTERGTALSWKTGGEAPDLTDATLTVVIDGEINLTGAVVDPSGSDQEVSCDLTAAQSQAITAGEHTFWIEAEWDDAPGEPHTFVTGTWTSARRYA